MKIHTHQLVSFLAASTTSLLVAGQQPGSDGLAVGQEICTFGYMMDEFCINRGNLFDAPDFLTLENPEQHSLGCLVQVPDCFNSPFHVLTDPELLVGDSATAYGAGWALSDNAVILEQTRALEESESKGLRMEVRGTVVTLDPPVIDFTSAAVIAEGVEGCTGDAPPPPPPAEETNGDDPSTDESAAAAPGVLLSFAALFLATW